MLLVSLVVSSVLVFAFMALLPGDPARVALGVNASDQAVATLRHDFGLDRLAGGAVRRVGRRAAARRPGGVLHLPGR